MRNETERMSVNEYIPGHVDGQVRFLVAAGLGVVADGGTTAHGTP